MMIGQNGFHWKGHILSSIKVGGMQKHQDNMRGTPPCLHHDRIYLSTQTELLSSMEARAPTEHTLMTAGLSLQDKKPIHILSGALEDHHQRELMIVDFRATTADVTIVHQMMDVGQSKIQYGQMQQDLTSLVLRQVPEQVVRQMLPQ